MANLFLDSFGHYNVTITQMPTKWTSAGGSIVSGLNTGSTFGFRGGAAKTLGLFPTLAAGSRHFVGTSHIINGFRNEVGVDINIDFTIASDGRIVANVNSVPVATSTFAITFGATYHFQTKSTFSYTLFDPLTYIGTHTFEVYVNGVLRLSGSFTTGNTRWGGDITELQYAEIYVHPDDGAGGWIGDLWVTDGELLGQCPVLLFLATADGPVLNWTPLSGSDHFAMVNMQVPDDTTYNFDNVSGDIDEYQMATVPAGTIKGAQVVVRLEKDAPSTATLQIVYRNGAGTTVLGTPVFAPSQDSYAFFLDSTRKSVFTAADWTPAEWNSGFAGIKRVT